MSEVNPDERVPFVNLDNPVVQSLLEKSKKRKADRSLSQIAREILDDWKKPYFGAVPYINAMLDLNKITDDFHLDSGISIVRYFLSNAGTWRGETARRIKAELKTMIKEVK